MKPEIIKFSNIDIPCFVNGRILVAINPIATAIGLDAKRAIKTISKDEILGAEGSIQALQLADKQTRNYFCLPLEHLHGWLFTIPVNKVNPSARQKLIEYKKECYKALFQHFFGNSKKIASNIERRHLLNTRLKKVNRIINRGYKMREEIKKEIDAIDLLNYQQLGFSFKKELQPATV